MDEQEIAKHSRQSEAPDPKPEPAYHLFCLIRPGLMPPLEASPVAGWGPLFLQPYLDVAAVLSAVSLEEFCGPAAEIRMQDLSWIGPRACRHEEVIEQVIRHSPAFPARFGTLFTSTDKVELLLKRHYTVISEFLDYVAGKEEWAVKGLLHRTTARRAARSIRLAGQEKRLASASPGTRYVQEQRLRAQADRELNRWVAEICGEVANDLSARACGFCERRVIANHAADEDMDVMLNWAFLVPRAAVADFHSRIGELNACHAGRGLVFQISGPWPPYSFSPSVMTEPAV